ncbi:MAG TPA: hypothetical protein VFJ57_08200 [Solirubrobacterales bacterium]|nr:hypothetical protein [Solirubrobacterales bacterium]
MSRRLTAASLLALLLALTSLLAGGGVWGAFTTKAASSASNTITAATDFRAPTASAATIGKTPGGIDGLIKKSGTYYVYASVTDTGNPASGIASVTANVSTITSGQTAAALTAGTYTADGASYNYRSASLTAGSTLAAGSLSYSLTLKDTAGNSRTESGFTVTVDNTAPAGADIQTTNGGAVAGRADAGDKITFTFSKEIDPNSVLAGWSGASTAVVVRLNNATNDTATIFNSTNATQLPLGSINLGRTDYTTANVTFGASGTASTMVMSGNQIIITLGTQSAAATTAAATGTMSWTPSATATDAAGNATSTTAVNESGTADKEF